MERDESDKIDNSPTSSTQRDSRSNSEDKLQPIELFPLPSSHMNSNSPVIAEQPSKSSANYGQRSGPYGRGEPERRGDFKEEFLRWVVRYNISEECANELLSILRRLTKEQLQAEIRAYRNWLRMSMRNHA